MLILTLNLELVVNSATSSTLILGAFIMVPGTRKPFNLDYVCKKQANMQ